ncbi:MAG: 5-formyltetrahydrofolate cyclo-ligase [Paraglaciecola psychrophila]
MPDSRATIAIDPLAAKQPANEHKRQLRRQLRSRRRALSSAQQRCAALRLDRSVAASGLLLRRGSFAAYRASDGEIDPQPLIKRLRKCARQCYLPLVMPGGTLRFARYHSGQTLTANRYGIGEPVKGGRLRKGWSINTVLLPLVGFDRFGGRMGMGGGFYDRSFQKLAKPGAGGSRLVGLAHRLQEVAQLPREPWDIGLSAVATDGEFIVFAQ